MTNVISFPTRRADAFPFYLARWPFLTVVEVTGSDPLPIRGRADTDGPVIEYHPPYASHATIADPSLALVWLSPCLMQIATAVLVESVEADDGIGRFTSPRWRAFRKEVSEQMGMEWSEIRDQSDVNGIDTMADDMTAFLLLESDLVDELGIA